MLPELFFGSQESFDKGRKFDLTILGLCGFYGGLAKCVVPWTVKRIGKDGFSLDLVDMYSGPKILESMR